MHTTRLHRRRRETWPVLGRALLVSVDPAARTDRTDTDLAAAVRLALDGGTPGGVEPLDWLSTTAPRHWRSGRP
jgi:alpha-galactosidase